MSSPPDDFSKLTKLLVCKRYEQPPPGYFERFPERVIARIENEELVEYSSWWRWIIEKFDAKPVVACVYGLTVSGLLLAGFRLSEMFEKEVASANAPVLPWLATTPGSSTIFPTDLSQGGYLDSNPLGLSGQHVFDSDRANLLFNGRLLQSQPISFNSGAVR